jgi:hypothetical protein
MEICKKNSFIDTLHMIQAPDKNQNYYSGYGKNGLDLTGARSESTALCWNF